MNAQQIADRLVEKGILRRGVSGSLLIVDDDGDPVAVFSGPRRAVNDWRTAGACLEIAMQRGIELDVGTELPPSLPAAICAAFAEVLPSTADDEFEEPPTIL